jgi:hypothetical protein
MTRVNFLKALDAFPSKLGLQAIESMPRSLGYIILPRIVFAAGDQDYIEFAGLLLALAHKARSDREVTLILSLAPAQNSSIKAMCLQCWSGGIDSESNAVIETGPVELSDAMVCIAPFMGRGLAPASLPVGGVIRDRFITGVDHTLPISEDGSMIYLAASVRGFWELAKALGEFAHYDDADAVQFEHSLIEPGVQAASYELEFLKASSFAAQSLFN